MNFWQNLKKTARPAGRPFFILAPMDDVTDTVFRQIIASIAPPDVFFTEFVSADGLCSQGAEKMISRLRHLESERPLVAQIWGVEVENYYTAAKMISKMGFSGIDINMGCPDSKVIKKGACSALIKNQRLAGEVIQAVKEGAPNLPISVKTRIGFRNIETGEWITFLLQQDLDALTIHGRTVSEMSKVPAHWDEIKKAVEIRDRMGIKTLIIGNGDVKTRAEGLKKVKDFKVDGVMIGRGIFQDPWVFAENIHLISQKEKMRTLLKHARLFENTWGSSKNFATLRKFFKAYVSSFNGASNLRVRLLETHNLSDVERLLAPYLENQRYENSLMI